MRFSCFKLTAKAAAYLLFFLTYIFSSVNLVAQPCGECSGCEEENDVTLFQCHSNIPGNANFGCQKFANWALENKFIEDHVFSCNFMDMIPDGNHPYNYSGTNPFDEHIGLVPVQLTKGNLLNAWIGYFGTSDDPHDEHWAFFNQKRQRFYSKDKSPGHIYEHGTGDLSCLGYVGLKYLYTYVGDTVTVNPASALSVPDNEICVIAGETIEVSLWERSSVEYSWDIDGFSPPLNYLCLNAECSKISITVPSSFPGGIGTLRVSYVGENMPVNGNTSRQQEYDLKIINCNIIGEYTYYDEGDPVTYPLATWNFTDAYHTHVTIDDCENETLNWTKTSGEGDFSLTNNGRNATVYLNGGESLVVLIEGVLSGASRTVTFMRLNGLTGDENGQKQPNNLNFNPSGQSAFFEKNIKNGRTSDLNVFPNPFSNFIMIESNDSNLPILIYNSEGVLIKKLAQNGMLRRVDLSDIPKGVYVIQKGEQIKKLIKQ